MRADDLLFIFEHLSNICVHSFLLVKQVARLQELTASLEMIIKQRSLEFESLKQEADRLKLQYEKESTAAANMAQSLKGQLANEQTKNSQLIAQLKDDIKAKATEMSNLQSTASQRSRTIDDMKSKLEAYQKESERTIEEGKKRIASLTADFEKRLASNQEAHQSEQMKLQNDIQRLQQDITSRSKMITDLETKLSSASSSIKKLSGEIVGLNTARHSTESLLKQSSHDLERTKQVVENLKKEIQKMQQFDANNTAKINALERELSEKSALLSKLQSESNEAATEKQLLLEELDRLKQWQNSAQASINTMSNEIAFNALSDEITQSQPGKIDQIITKLTGIRNELNQKDAQLSYAKSSTEALLKGQPEAVYSSENMIESRPLSPGAGNANRSSYARPNIIGSGFNSRQKNVATVRTSRFSSGSGPGQEQIGSPQVEVAPSMPQPVRTKNAYDAALASSGKEAPIGIPVPDRPSPQKGYGIGGWKKTASKGQSTPPSPSLSGNPLKGETNVSKGYGFGKGAWKTSQPKSGGGGGYLDNMSP